jgi:hypothetical protein
MLFGWTSGANFKYLLRIAQLSGVEEIGIACDSPILKLD